MNKKIILLLMALFLLSCNSPFSNVGMKFKDREGIYENQEKTIKVTVTTGDNQNLNIHTYSGSGIGVVEETFDITPAVTTGDFILQSKINTYTYVINFYGSSSLHFSVREGASYKISNAELNNTKEK